MLSDREFCVTNRVSVNNVVVESKTGSDLFDSYSLGIVALNDEGISPCHRAFEFKLSVV